jgi:hypothetical protein
MITRPRFGNLARNCAFILSAITAQAVTIDFTALDLGPSAVLQYGGVTITDGGGQFGPSSPSIPTMVAGIGLGSSALGSAGTLDRVQAGFGYISRESLRLSVDGNITSVVVDPYYFIRGSNEKPPSIYFDISVAGGFLFYAHGNEAPVTITFTGLSSYHLPVTYIELGLIADFGNEPIWQYEIYHPGTVFEFGYSITSLTYTPRAAGSVPDGGATLAMLAPICVILCLVYRRREIPRPRALRGE